MPTKDEVFQKVQSALVDALGVDEEEVTATATMVGDLGAESIDFLDIVFRLEKAFSIEIPRSELFPEDILTNAEYVKEDVAILMVSGSYDSIREIAAIGKRLLGPTAVYVKQPDGSTNLL